MRLEESLRALGADDTTQVPAHVDTAIMAAWDAGLIDRAGKRLTPGPRQWRPLLVASVALLVVIAAAASRSPGDPAPPRSTAVPAPLIRGELVLVPEIEAGAPLTLMRVRMSRREFSRLGVRISNPDGEGLVDVEVLVGEDGVARSIRRAVAVARTGPNP